MQNYTNIIEIIISLLSALITVFLIPLLKQRLTQEKQEKLIFWIQTAVTAAEQIYGTKAGQKKKEYVVKFLLSKGIVFDVDEVSALIESEVYKLKEATDQAAV